MASLSPYNPCVQAFITQALQAHPTSTRGHAVFEEFDCATYHLEHSREQPDVCTLMLVIGSPAPPGAATSIADDPQLHGVATALQAVPGFQLAVKVSLPRLQKLGKGHQAEAIRALSCLRLALSGHSLRCQLERLAEASCSLRALTVFPRPRQPFYTCSQPAAVLVAFPLWRSRTPDADLLRTAFVQEFMEAQRAPGLSDAPRCTYTPPGRPLPFELTPEQRSSLQLPYKGSLSFAIHSHHVAGPEAVQAVLHNLLMLYSFLDMQVCSFKVSMHAKMRQEAEILLSALQQALVHPEDKAHEQAVPV